MEIRNLITFTKVAEVQSLSRAAKELEYAQSTVTMQMQQLEQELGVSLYERVGRSIQITQAGQELLTYANHIIKMSEAALQIGKKTSEVVDGSLRIGVLEALSGRRMTDQIQRYLQTYPHVELQIMVCRSSPELLGRLKHNELDLIITLDSYLADPMLVHADDQEEMVHFYAAYQEPFCENDGPTHTFLQANPDTAWEMLLVNQLSQIPRSKVHQIMIQNQAMAISMAERQAGILLLPDSVALEYTEAKRLRRLEHTLPETNYWRQSIYHKNKWLTGAMKAWLNMQGDT